ncbi:hypothetical protein ACVDFE_00085 [Lentzea chajnantorensis]
MQHQRNNPQHREDQEEQDMPNHRWSLSAGTTGDLAHGSAGDVATARRQALDAAAELVTAGHVEPFVLMLDDEPAAHIAPARDEGGQALVTDTLDVLAGLRSDLSVDA